MLPYDLATQEFRVHYAGFFDPGFGYGMQGEIPGTRAVLEVRASPIPILLEDDQLVGRLNYYKMSGKPLKVYGGTIGSSYQQQGLALSKQFKREDQYISSSAVNAGRDADQRSKIKTSPDSKPERAEMEEEDEEPLFSLAFPGPRAEHLINAKTDEGGKV